MAPVRMLTHGGSVSRTEARLPGQAKLVYLTDGQEPQVGAQGDFP